MIGTSAKDKKSLDKLKKLIEEYSNKKNCNEKIINYNCVIEDAIKKMSLTLKKLINKEKR